MIIYYGVKKRSILDYLLLPLILIGCCNLFWLPTLLAATNCATVTEIPQAECEALVTLYNSTDGPNWSDSPGNNWNVTNTPCSDWAGITCDGGHVIQIDRSEKNLTGSIPDWSALTSLQHLGLWNNQLTGSIPDWSMLTSLQHLDLGGNQLTGSIPDWSMLTSLQYLVLSDNQLTGSIPDWSALTSLQQLYLSDNELIGSIPDWSALTSLQHLVLSSNQLTGSIPGWSTLTSLRTLSLSFNQLTGSIPDWSALTSLQGLELFSNQLTGLIPDWSALTSLQGLYLSSNQLTGSIPDWSTLTSLQGFDLGFNQLTGSIPDWSMLTSLRTLSLSFNQLTGSIPDWSALMSLQILWLNDNQLCGEISKSLVNLPIDFLSLGNNHLTASDPTLINFLNNKSPSWINQTPCDSSSPSPTPPSTPPATPLPSTMKLTAGFTGNGHGQITSIPSGIDCDTSKTQTQCSYSFNTGTPVKLTATPAADSQFIRWLGNRNDCEDGELFMTVTTGCIAQFELLHFPLTVTTTGQGKVKSDPVGIDCSQCVRDFDIGTKVMLTAVPEKGWQFQEWTGDCDDQGTVIIKANQACQATFTQLPPDYPPVADVILTACANAILWDGQTNEDAVVKNTGTLNLAGSNAPIKVKALCNYGTIQATAGELLAIQVNPTEGFIYNEGSILGQNGQSSTAKSTIPTNLVNTGDNGSSIKLKAGIQLYNQGLIQAGAGGNGYLTAGRGGSVEIYADQIIQAGIISAGNGGEGNAHQPEWDGVWESETSYGNQAVWGGQGGKTLLHAKQSLHATVMATTSSGTGGNAYVWCRNGAYLIDWWFDGRWYAGTCVSDNANLPVAIPTPGKGGDLIQLSPALYDLSQARSGKGLYYEPSTITLSTETQLQAQEDILIFGGNDWVLDLRHLSAGAISTLGNITLAVGKDGIIDLRGNTGKIFQAGGQFTVFTDTLWLDDGISLADLVAAPAGIVTHPSKIISQVILNGPEQITGEPQTTLPIELELINGGPEADVYYLTVSDAAGWKLSTLPSPIAVAGLGHETLQLNVTLPTTIDEQDAITITATSAAEPTVTSSTQIGVKVVEDPNQSATTTVEINKPPLITDNLANVAANNDETVTTVPEVELPPLTEIDSLTIPATSPFSLLPPQTPPCYTSGLVDWVCNANGQQLTDLTVGPNGMIAYGTLIGTLINQGWVSNLTLKSNSQLTGGIVTGYITNHGEMADFEFRGAAIVGGMLAGKISNTSQIGGYFRDVQLAAGTQLSSGQLVGNISGNAQAPALLEHVTIRSGSFIAGVKLGDGVIVEDNVTCGENVQAPTGVCQAASSSEPELQNFPDLGVTASTQDGATVATHAVIRGGITVNGAPLASPATVTLADEVTIQGQIQVDPTQVGQAGEVVVYVEYTPLGTNKPIDIMLNENGESVEWDSNLAHLAPFQVIPKLAESIDVLMYQGQLPVTGTLNIGLGYRLADGLVVHNLEPVEVNISQ
jgi:Leucine-rich repeat (LRR) protein